MWTPNYYDALSVGGAGTRLLLTPAQHRASDPTDPHVTLRKYDNLHFKLFYSSSIADGAMSDAPTITFVEATVVGHDVHFTAHVVGDPRAGVQETWITYTGLTTDWQSIPLTQDATDSSLWTGTLNVGTLPTTLTELDFMVQAVNGFGLVGLNDNLGAYHKAFLLAGGAPPQLSSSLAFTAATTASGPFGSSATFSADLTAPDDSGQTIKFTLGGVSRYGVTNGSGVASVTFPLNLDPGTHPVSASFVGDASALGSSASTSVTIAQTATSLVLGGPGSATYLTNTGVTATLSPPAAPAGWPDRGHRSQRAGGSGTVTAITDPVGVARLGIVTLPAGTYALTANFAGDVDYAAAPGRQTANLMINPLTAQTYDQHFGGLGNKNFGSPDFNLIATATSTLPVSFASTTPLVCTPSPA